MIIIIILNNKLMSRVKVFAFLTTWSLISYEAVTNTFCSQDRDKRNQILLIVLLYFFAVVPN